MKRRAEAVAARQTPMVVEDVVVEHGADSGAGDRTGRAAEQAGYDRTRQSAEYSADRSADRANGCAGFGTGQCHRKTTGRACDASDCATGSATDIERFNTSRAAMRAAMCSRWGRDCFRRGWWRVGEIVGGWRRAISLRCA